MAQPGPFLRFSSQILWLPSNISALAINPQDHSDIPRHRTTLRRLQEPAFFCLLDVNAHSLSVQRTLQIIHPAWNSWSITVLHSSGLREEALMHLLGCGLAATDEVGGSSFLLQEERRVRRGCMICGSRLACLALPQLWGAMTETKGWLLNYLSQVATFPHIVLNCSTTDGKRELTFL